MITPPSTTAAPDRMALTIVWSHPHPERVGQSAYLLPAQKATLRSIETSEPGDLTFSRANTSPALPLKPTSPVHITLEASGDRILFERHHAASLCLDGIEVDRGLLNEGDTLLVNGEILLLYERRPSTPTVNTFIAPSTFSCCGIHAPGLTGESPATKNLRQQIQLAAGTRAPVLILGPPGSFKDGVAAAIHANSDHRRNPFLLLHGAALTRDDLDHIRQRDDAPFVAIAQIADTPPELRPLLSSLITHQQHPDRPQLRLVGSSSVPLTSLTHGPHPLSLDFAYAFVITVKVPGLESRRADIPLLAHALANSFASEQPAIGRRFFDHWDGVHGEPRITSELISRLVRHRWRAHVRELTGLLWTSIATSPSDWLDLTPAVEEAMMATQPEPSYRDPSQLDERAVRDALRQSGGKVTAAARLLGLKNRWVLYRLMERYNLR